MIISVDMSQMSRIIWLDEQNLTLCVEAGIIGQDLERKLQKRGYTVGHEPDSLEFSSLGGWISTRASGMKKNTYGNIEDLLVNVNYITPIGVINKKAAVPRMSCGPDLDHIILGSEGTMGIITTAVLKIRPLPPMTEFDSIVFHCFEDGIKFCRQIARERTYCASIRLIDNNQFQFGYALKPSAKSFYQSVKNSFVKFYVTKYKGIDVTKMSIATLVFVGTYHEVCHQRSNIFRIAATFNGFSGGAENGRRGYNLTNSIAYIRDLALKTNIVAESFETSAPWDKVDKLISNVKQRIHEECKKYEISNPFVSARVTQLYDEGACIYFYLGLYMVPSIEDPIHIYEQIEMLARDEIIANGGCISHHHGVGTIRKKWYKTTISETAHDVLKSVKKKLDPNNIFANGNLTNKEYS
ncbi:Alkyl-DHAP synthase [Intoshia linei]|uniref:Alkylglycerone-phosphate synthase n=1 Tax=Intoshia linei TaxID=1819745 RepID=A0A177B229_9BILA|nr:Alkyl-DHAP synthase [Intoshia linei]